MCGAEGRSERYAGTDSWHMYPVVAAELRASDDGHSKLATSLWTQPESHTGTTHTLTIATAY